jgi:hypothetical protein
MQRAALLICLLSFHLTACNAERESKFSADCLPDSVVVSRLTSGPKQHFASAYYHLRTLNASGTHILCLETTLSENRNPVEGENATLGLVDLPSGKFTPLTETRAWNFQQGAMQQWLGTSPDTLITYNDLRDGRFVSIERNVFSGAERVIGRALSAVSPDGRRGLSLNFARLHQTRPGYGYPGPGDDPRLDDPHPQDDGLWSVNLASGESRLIVSLDDLFRLNPPDSAVATGRMWINHTMFNTDGTRVSFLGRSPRREGKGWVTAVYTVNPDGSELRTVLGYDWGGSHYDWLSADSLMYTTLIDGRLPMAHVLFCDCPQGPAGFRAIGAGILTQDGHGTFSPDSRWMVTDTYPDGAGYRTLLLLRLRDDTTLRLGRFRDYGERFSGPARCDLHPRFQGGDSLIVFDSVDDGTRQVYLARLINR